MSETPLSGMPVNYREAITAFQHGDRFDLHTSNLRPYEDVVAERMAEELAAASNVNPTSEVLPDHLHVKELTVALVGFRRERVDATISLLDEEPTQNQFGLPA